MKVLKSDAQLAAGDPELCGGCSAVFNMYSTLTSETEDVKMDDDDQLWRCEFCGHNNVVNLEQEEIPTKDAVNYVLEHPNAGEDANMEDIAVIFCLDTSGSMCVSKQIQGKFEIKGDRTAEMQELMKFSDGSDQYAWRDRGSTYVSRMQCV